jgi:hypothetical protein
MKWLVVMLRMMGGVRRVIATPVWAVTLLLLGLPPHVFCTTLVIHSSLLIHSPLFLESTSLGRVPSERITRWR